MRRSNRDRFDEKWELDPETGCWMWTAGQAHGYGSFSLYYPEEDRYGSGPASKAAWQIYHGQVPAGMHVLHYCGRKLCVNPDGRHHLYLGTQADNSADQVRLGEMPRGEAHWNARLTEDEVREIRALKGQLRAAVIARRFGVSHSLVSMILDGSIWKHI